MFNTDDLAERVSEMKLGDIIEMGATEDDLTFSSDLDLDEIRRPVRVRLNEELIISSGVAMKKFRCSSNMFYKCATKLGAMILRNSQKISILRDINWLLTVIFEAAQEFDDMNTVRLRYQYSERILNTSKHLKIGGSDKTIYPFPKWRKVLDSMAWESLLNKSDIYRMAIAHALGTEFNIYTPEELDKRLNIVISERLNTTQDFCVVFKNSASFIKHDYKDYIKQRVRKKELSEEVRKIVEELIRDEG